MSKLGFIVDGGPDGREMIRLEWEHANRLKFSVQKDLLQETPEEIDRCFQVAAHLVKRVAAEGIEQVGSHVKRRQ